jgi:uncharacterized protein (DUF2235 family)
MKRILLFSDGTGNSSAKAQKTNVWRLFQAADLTGSAQIAHYDDGVGTSSNKYLAMLGGVFGWGLKRNVIDLYKFVCLNYQPGDEIFGFGFSRGAFTIRLLVGMIVNQGLLRPMGEEELDRYARAVYRAYRSARISPNNYLFKTMRAMRDTCLRWFDEMRDLPLYCQEKNRQDVPIRFLGLWDTVGAYEIPINALKRAVGIALWPMDFVDLKLAEAVQHTCHALSLDDERQTFHPVPFDESAEARLVADNLVEPGRLKQVWFPGVHCNVGGGYPEDRLSYCALHWIMSEAAAAGMQLIPAAIDHVLAEKSPYARIYDSRAGFASFYRYAPRHIRIWHDTTGREIAPVVDSSVVLRMADGTDRYAPVPLPGRFWLLEETGTLKPMFGTPRVIPANAATPVFPPVPRLGIDDSLATISQRLGEACDRFQPAPFVLPNPQALLVVAATVWWRRVAYWIQFAFAASLVFFPAYSPTPLCTQQRCDAPEAAFAATTGDMLARTINALKGLLPSVSTRWTDAFGAHPDLFALLAIALLVSLNFGRVLKIRVSDRARMAWHTNFQPIYLVWCRRSAMASCRLTAVIFVMALLLAGATAFFQRGSLQQGVLIPGIEAKITPTTLEFAAASFALLLLLLWRTYRLWVLKNAVASAGAPLPTTFALALANRLRTNISLVMLYRGLSNRAIPMICIVVFFGAAIAMIHRALFDAALASGYLCNTASANRQSDPFTFKTANFCWDSGIFLEKDASYVITLKTPGNWFDAAERADVGGFPTDTLAHYTGWPLRRNWGTLWFKPIARIGATGSDEYVLDPVNPFAPHQYHNDLKVKEHHWQPISPDEATNGMQNDPTPADRMTLSAKITAHRAGELFLYVNDAVLAPPLDIKWFYLNNYGSAEVTVDRLCPDGTLWRMNPGSVAPAANAVGTSLGAGATSRSRGKPDGAEVCLMSDSSAETAVPQLGVSN